ACAVLDGPHTLPTTFTVSSPTNAPLPLRVSSTRQGATGYNDSPFCPPGGAKYPLMSITRSVSLLANALMLPSLSVPAGTIAALAVVTPVGAFSVDTRGCDCPNGHTVR